MRRILESAARLSQRDVPQDSVELAPLREVHRRWSRASPTLLQIATEFVRVSLPTPASELARRAGLEQAMVEWIAEQLLDSPEGARHIEEIWRRLGES